MKRLDPKFVQRNWLLVAVFAAAFLSLGAVGQAADNEETFEARVIKIIDQRMVENEDSQPTSQQNLQLKALTGSIAGQEFVSTGIGAVEVVSGQQYQPGDRVVVVRTDDADQQTVYYVTDIVRRSYLYWLVIIFVVLVALIGRGKGVRSLLALALTILIMLVVIAPLILQGFSPLLVAVVGGLLIMAAVIYLTEGWRPMSHLAMASIFVSLLATAGLALIATIIMQISGFSQEEAVYLATISQGGQIDFRGLLLAGIIIGVLGVLDDVVVSQLEAVRQLKIANPDLRPNQIFSSAFKIGTTHLGAVVNTLFLAYSGASLPLVLLLVVNQETGMGLAQIINSELIATELVRTLVGGIGLTLAIPIATILGAYWLKQDQSANHQH